MSVPYFHTNSEKPSLTHIPGHSMSLFCFFFPPETLTTSGNYIHYLSGEWIIRRHDLSPKYMHEDMLLHVRGTYPFSSLHENLPTIQMQVRQAFPRSRWRGTRWKAIGNMGSCIQAGHGAPWVFWNTVLLSPIKGGRNVMNRKFNLKREPKAGQSNIFL